MNLQGPKKISFNLCIDDDYWWLFSVTMRQLYNEIRSTLASSMSTGPLFNQGETTSAQQFKHISDNETEIWIKLAQNIGHLLER